MSTYFQTKLFGLLIFFVTPRRDLFFIYRKLFCAVSIGATIY